MKLHFVALNMAHTVEDPDVMIPFSLFLSLDQQKPRISLFRIVNKLTSTRAKDLILRLVHGELYSKERLYRYQLVDTPMCPRCNQIETLVHKSPFVQLKLELDISMEELHHVPECNPNRD